jgi:hypothetical protein
MKIFSSEPGRISTITVLPSNCAIKNSLYRVCPEDSGFNKRYFQLPTQISQVFHAVTPYDHLVITGRILDKPFWVFHFDRNRCPVSNRIPTVNQFPRGGGDSVNVRPDSDNGEWLAFVLEVVNI